MSGRTLFLHIGPPKTATSFLQRDLLTAVRSAACRIKPTVTLGSGEVTFGDFFLQSPHLWREVGDEVFRSLIGENQNGDGKDLIVSEEEIFGGVTSPQPWIPSWIGESARRYGSTVRVERQTSGQPEASTVARHVEALAEIAADWGFSETKVLLTLRRQDTKLASGYAQMSNRVKGASQSHFEAWITDLVVNPLGYYMGGGMKLNYFLWWKELEAVLGEENMLFLPFELLQENKNAFLKRWLQFLDVADMDRILHASRKSGGKGRKKRSESKRVWRLRDPMSVGPSLGIEWLLGKMGISSNWSLQWMDFRRDKKIRLTDELKNQIVDVYQRENRRLEDTVEGLEIGRYGYY